MIIPLTRGLVAQVDEDDAALTLAYRWHPLRASNGRGWYAQATIPGTQPRRLIYLHKLLMPGCAMVDHRNGDGLDCRRENMRPATPSQNQANSRGKRGGTSRYKGVWLHACRATWARPWVAAIVVDGRKISLGYHATEEDAARAYDTAARRLFGEFARPNFASGEPA